MYKPEFAKQAVKLCRLGATDKELADFFEVNVDTVYEWRKVHEAFAKACQKGKALADAEVADKLFKRATGYKHKAEKIFNDNGEAMRVEYTEHYPPDTTACIFWLKNRRPDLWRDRVEQAVIPMKPVTLNYNLNDEDETKGAA